MRAMGVLGGVLGVPLLGGLHRWSGLGVVGALVLGARTVLGGCVLLGREAGVLEGWSGAGLVGLQGGGPAASIPVSCVGHQP